MRYRQLSSEAEQVLNEILDHEGDSDYWCRRFEDLPHREESILRGCFRELSNANMISTMWASNVPYAIDVLKDGYLYEKHKTESQFSSDNEPTTFEQELNELLTRTASIRLPTNMTTGGMSLHEHNRPSAEWINDVEIFYNRYLTDHALGARIKSILFHRRVSAYSELIECLNSIRRDRRFIDSMANATLPASKLNQQPLYDYDVFISHANSDKPTIVEDLYASLNHLGIRIFYDKESLEWGDNWKNRILDGTAKAEFAIIVISENFFDREWTEKELNEFLHRQNTSGQKVILPILHGISAGDLRQKYPSVADIQAINSADHTCDQIALLFAKQFIKRLRS